MFPDRLLSYDHGDAAPRDGEPLRPRWLTSRDDAWLEELLREIAAIEGAPAGVADERVIEASRPMARAHGIGRRLLEGVWLVERRRFKTSIDSPVPPVVLRRTLFDHATERSREEAVETTGAEVGLPAAEVLRCLFADRQKLRILQRRGSEPTLEELRERYNLTLAQSLLVRAAEVVATVRGHARRVVGYAKLLGLMVAFETEPDAALRLTVSGPLALFHDTLKYGRALATWMPALVSTPAWHLRARILVGGAMRSLELDARAPLERAHALPRAFDSKLEARLDRDLRRLRLPWRIERESAMLTVGTRLAFPDFSLVSEDGRRVAVEIAGFWTEEYLAKKVGLLEAARGPFVLCVDARREGSFASLPSELTRKILPFKERVDANALAEACARALESSSMASPRPVTSTPAAADGASSSRSSRSHWLTVPSTPWLEQHACALGADRGRWREELAEDLAERATAHLALDGRPRLFIVGRRFAVEVVRDKTRDDALFVHRVLSPRAAASSRTAALDASLSLRAPGATSSPRDAIGTSIGWARREAESNASRSRCTMS